jgi:hypothetical protein
VEPPSRIPEGHKVKDTYDQPDEAEEERRREVDSKYENEKA